MNPWDRLKRALRPQKLDHSSNFPRTLWTETRGPLVKKRSALIVGSERIVFCRYETPPDQATCAASYHPNLEVAPCVEQWKELFDRRLRYIESNWRELISNAAQEIGDEAKDMLEEGASIAQLFDSLELVRISVSHDESLSLRFDTSPLLKYHNLGVDFDSRNKLIKVSIEG